METRGDKWRLSIGYSPSIHRAHSQWGQRVNMQLQLKWSAAYGISFHPKRKARGKTGKTVKTHFIASAALSATAAWELLTPLSDCPWAVPVPKVT